jgi:hypothetical protein
MIFGALSVVIWETVASLGQAGGQAAPGGGNLDAKGGMVFAGGAPRANFQPYIFWAYSLACVLLFLFTLWTLVETKQLGKRISTRGSLRAHPASRIVIGAIIGCRPGAPSSI